MNTITQFCDENKWIQFLNAKSKSALQKKTDSLFKCELQLYELNQYYDL